MVPPALFEVAHIMLTRATRFSRLKRAAFDVVTEAGAKALGLTDYGLRVGATADLVTLAAEHVPEAVVAVPKPRTVYKAGKRIHTHKNG